MRAVKLLVDDVEYVGHMAENYAELPKKVRQEVALIAYTMPKTWETRLEVWDRVFFAGRELREILTHPDRVSELLRLLDFTEWVWTGGFDKRPFEGITIGSARLWLPDENLQYVSTAEFVSATAYLIAFSAPLAAESDHSEKWPLLDQFMACVARPRRSVVQRLTNRNKPATPHHPDDRREPFSQHRIDRLATDVMSRVSLPTKIMVLQWFLAATKRMQDAYGMVGDDKADQPLQLGLFLRDWEQTIHELAKAGNFGRYDDVMNRPIHDVLAWLELRKTDKQANAHDSE